MRIPGRFRFHPQTPSPTGPRNNASESAILSVNFHFFPFLFFSFHFYLLSCTVFPMAPFSLSPSLFSVLPFIFNFFPFRSRETNRICRHWNCIFIILITMRLTFLIIFLVLIFCYKTKANLVAGSWNTIILHFF